jgi:hypothetical protein
VSSPSRGLARVAKLVLLPGALLRPPRAGPDWETPVKVKELVSNGLTSHLAMCLSRYSVYFTDVPRILVKFWKLDVSRHQALQKSARVPLENILNNYLVQPDSPFRASRTHTNSIQKNPEGGWKPPTECPDLREKYLSCRSALLPL